VDAVVVGGSADDDGGSPAGESAPSPVDEVHAAAVTSRSPPTTAAARRSRTRSSVGARVRPRRSPRRTGAPIWPRWGSNIATVRAQKRG
jgi:hypothetical protein